jgi:hypothetical protein
MKPLAARRNKSRIEADHVDPERKPRALSPEGQAIMAAAVERIRAARRGGRPVMLAFGAHTIKNGLAPVLIRLLEEGWLTHLATNGAGIIHDWEFAYQGASAEDVRANIERGEFGNWEETGYTINLALNIGAYEGQGYGEAVGALIHNDGLEIPAVAELERTVKASLPADPERAAAAADCLAIVKAFKLPAGRLSVPHPWKRFSVQGAAYRLRVPFTGHPMFGHDIIYQHPMNHGGLLGRAALRDFLTFAECVSRLEGGVYLSLGSAVMSPMIFEKSFAMAQNLALQAGRRIADHFILVVDLTPAGWDWTQSEPPPDDPAYYQRFNKSFSRMGGALRYLAADNRDFLLHLWQALRNG